MAAEPNLSIPHTIGYIEADSPTTDKSMIRHIVLFRARDPKDARAVRDGLRYLHAIPSATLLEVEFNARKDAWSDEIDVVVYGEFEDEAALDAFKAHPVYEETIRLVKPMRDLRFAVDYQAPGRK